MLSPPSSPSESSASTVVDSWPTSSMAHRWKALLLLSFDVLAVDFDEDFINAGVVASKNVESFGSAPAAGPPDPCRAGGGSRHIAIVSRIGRVFAFDAAYFAVERVGRGLLSVSFSFCSGIVKKLFNH